MADTEVALTRPQRWDAPLDPSMGDVELDRLLAVEPFRDIDPTCFPPSLPLREIMRNDCRVLRCASGDIIVREGDYGHSAFLVLSGRVRVVVAGLSTEVLGRAAPAKLGWLASLFKVMRQPQLAEVRGAYAADKTIGPSAVSLRGSPEQPRVFLQDVPRVLDETNTVALEPGEIFGELAAITRSPRTATVFAEGDAVLLEIRWQGLRDLMRRTDALRRHIEQLYRENSLRVHLREAPLLAQLSPEQLGVVAEATIFESHGEFDWTRRTSRPCGAGQATPLSMIRSSPRKARPQMGSYSFAPASHDRAAVMAMATVRRRTSGGARYLV